MKYKVGDRFTAEITKVNACNPFPYELNGRDWVTAHMVDILKKEKEPTDWSKVSMDAPIMVREYGEWNTYHFAGLSDEGRPCFWLDGLTSHTTTDRDNKDSVSTKDIMLRKDWKEKFMKDWKEKYED